MLDVIKRIFIGVCIGMCIFFLKTEVFALSWDLVQQDEFFIFDTAKSNSWSVSNSPNVYTFQGSTFDHSYTNTNGYNFMVIPIVSSVDYSFLDPDTSSNLLTGGLTDVIIRVVLVSNGNWSTCEIQNNFVVCPILKDLTYTAIRFYYVNPINVQRYTVNLRINNTVSLQNFNFVSAIQQQTDDIQNTDAPADNTYNNDYSTSSYDTAESNMNSHLDTDVSGLSFDPTSWASTFSYIWSLVTDFLSISNKVFVTITTFLTFSFVGLVIGRS